MNCLRVIFDEPGSGFGNMAVDEALLHTADATNQATLRFYTWNEATLSLGHFQSAADRQQHAPSRNCPLVRRASGGGAILHDRELTYSIVLPRAAATVEPADLYELAHQSLIAALAEFGVTSMLFREANPCSAAAKQQRPEPLLCFQRRTCFDIVCRGEKIVGSAQRRRRAAILQHGSILLAQSACAPELPGIEELCGVNIEAHGLARVWLPKLAGALQLSTQEGGLDENERSLARQLMNDRFASAAYAGRR